MEIIDALNWRYATKKFDPAKRISHRDLETLCEVLRLTPSSYGLQPLKFLFIEDPEMRSLLRSHAYNQSQVTDASHLLVICAYNDINEEQIDAHIQNTASIRSVDPERMIGYAEFMKKTIQPLPEETKKNWNENQAYIALGQLLTACAIMRIDATPMEGFDSEKFDEILELKGRNLHSVLICPIGYRSADDPAQYNRKVRKRSEDLFETI